MTDPLNVDARLSPEEVDMIDSYFSRNYKRGERLEVSEECYKEGIKWKERRLRELGFYDRIYHRKKDRGERNDLEAAMAKLFASEVCGEVAMEAMRVHGGVGYTKELPIERYYRDAPLMIIGEGTNEIMKLLIARRLLENYAT